MHWVRLVWKKCPVSMYNQTLEELLIALIFKCQKIKEIMHWYVLSP